MNGAKVVLDLSIFQELVLKFSSNVNRRAKKGYLVQLIIL